MVMKPEPITRALAALEDSGNEKLVILLTPQGKSFDQETAWEFSRFSHLVLICGRYEGVDERVRLSCIDRELSIGDYVLSGGEPAAMVVMDVVARLLPGVLGSDTSNTEDSFEEGLLEYPHYTRPRIFEGREVPPVLLSGNHEAIRKWRRREALRRTREKRPDLLEKADLTAEDRAILAELAYRPPGE
jgi:tRNA (guanine37-N1)-methyltransferase